MKNVLVFGSGSIAKKHIKNLLVLKFNVYVFSKNNNNFVKNKKIIFIKNLNNLPNIYFAIIANKTNEHLYAIKFLINKKINIYCEKPIYFKKFNFKNIKKLIVKNKINFFMGYQLLNDSKVEYVKKKLKKHKAKSFQVSVGHNFEKWRKNGVRKDSYFSRKSMGGGVIFELIHEISLISDLFGKILKIKTIKSNSTLYKCEDVAVSIMETKKKLIGTLYQDMFSDTFFRHITIVTKNKLFKIDFKTNKVEENQKVIKFKNSNKQKDLLMKNILKFIQHIKKPKISTLSYDKAINDLNICLKMHEKF